MAIRYNLPETAAQQGPTCWYTAVALMVSFHDMIGPRKSHHNQWLELLALRDIISELAASKHPYDHRSVLAALNRRLSGSRIASAEHAQWTSLKNKWDADETDARFGVLDAFLPGVIKPVDLGAGSFDAAFVANCLTRYGPLYASVRRPATSLMDWDYVPDPFPNTRAYVYKYDAKSGFGGRHAIAIFGVDDRDYIYYADPNKPHRYSMIPWEVLKHQLGSPGGSMGETLVGRVDCASCRGGQVRHT
jgi:hypothetical protein